MTPNRFNILKTIELPIGLEISDLFSNPLYWEIIHFLDLTFPNWSYGYGLGLNTIEFLYELFNFALEIVDNHEDLSREDLIILYPFIASEYESALQFENNEKELFLANQFTQVCQEQDISEEEVQQEFSCFKKEYNQTCFFNLEELTQ